VELERDKAQVEMDRAAVLTLITLYKRPSPQPVVGLQLLSTGWAPHLGQISGHRLGGASPPLSPAPLPS
jgi:hypothetical protein